MERRILYESDTSRVVAVGLPARGTVCTTFFTYASDESTLPQVNGFAEDLLARLEIPALHFINLRNHWWHIADLDDCLAAGKAALRGSSRRIGYGASMGGYAALRFSSHLGLDEVLAFSPQFSIDRRLVPFETRWPGPAQRLDFSRERMRLRRAAVHHIVFDPRCTDDATHVRLIMQANPLADLRLHPVRNGEHFVLRAFQKAGLLSKIIERFPVAGVDADLIRSHPDYDNDAAREAARRSPLWRTRAEADYHLRRLHRHAARWPAVHARLARLRDFYARYISPL